MSYPVTLNERIDNILAAIPKRPTFANHVLTNDDNDEIRTALKSIPEFVNPCNIIRGTAPFRSPADMNGDKDVIVPFIARYIVAKHDNKLVVPFSFGINWSHQINVNDLVKKSFFARVYPNKITLRDQIYQALANCMTGIDWRLRAVEIFKKYIYPKKYGLKFKQAFYDMLELQYANSATPDVFGYAIDDYPLLTEVSNLLYSPDSRDHNLGKELDRLHINWRKIPKIMYIEQYPQPRTLEYIFNEIRIYLAEKYDIEYEIGTPGSRDAIDEAARRAGVLSSECENISYPNLQTQALAGFRRLTKVEKCDILQSYTATAKKPNALVEFEVPCLDYEDDELTDAFNDLLDYLPKITLCQLIDKYQ